MAPELINLTVSPWSLKARWALHYYNIQYHTSNHTPGIGEYWLRWKLGEWHKRVSAPVLITTSGNYADAINIAQWADAHANDKAFKNTGHAQTGEAKSIFPKDKLEDIRRVEKLCNMVMEYDRGQFLEMARTTPAIRRKFVPQILLKLPYGTQIADWLGSTIMTWFGKKYADVSAATTFEQAKTIVQDLREAATKGGDYLLGEFTYADIAGAVMVRGMLDRSPNARTPQSSELSQVIDEDFAQWAQKMIDMHFPVGCQWKAKI